MSLLAAALLLPAAARAGLHADLERELFGAPDVAVACTSAGELLRRVETAATDLGDDTPLDAVGPALAGIRSALAPEARVSMAFWSDTKALRLGFDTPLPAAELATRFAKDGSVFEGPRGWGIRAADGDETRITVVDGWATFSTGPDPVPATRNLPASMLASLPETPGCLISGLAPLDDAGVLDFSVHLPFTPGEPASFAATVPGLQSSEAILLEGAVPPTVRSPDRPLAVALLGFGLDNIDFSAFLEGAELREARRFQNAFPVTGGTTLAVLGMEPAPRVAAVIPFSGHMPAKKLIRRVLRFAKAGDIPVERTDATHLTFSAGILQIFVAASPNRLDVSTDAASLNAMQSGAGEPWIAGSVAELAAQWPLVFSAGAIPDGPNQPLHVLPRPLYLALDVEGGLLTGVLDVPLSLDEMAAMGNKLNAIVEARKAAKAAEPQLEE